MSTPAKQNFIIKANGNWEPIWQIQNSGVPFDITGYTFELTVRNGVGNTAPIIINLTTANNGIVVNDVLNGKIQIFIVPQPQIKQKVVYNYDLAAIKSGKHYIWMEGTMTFDPGTSY